MTAPYPWSGGGSAQPIGRLSSQEMYIQLLLLGNSRLECMERRNELSTFCPVFCRLVGGTGLVMVVVFGKQERKVESLNVARARLRTYSIFDAAIMFWSGTSGHAYVHTVYTLVGCPAMPPASALLVHRSTTGRLTPLGAISLDDVVPASNLARVRHEGSKLGANEVHLHFAKGGTQARKTATFDLLTRHCYTGLVGI